MEPPEDLSSMVKVEMEEGPAIDSATTGSEHQTPTTTPSPPPAPCHLIPPALKRFPPLPQVHAHHVDPFPPRIPGQELPNMFHFGDVAVSHHPDTPPVPMVIPMVYLYPIPSQEQGELLHLLSDVNCIMTIKKKLNSQLLKDSYQLCLTSYFNALIGYD